MDLALERLLAIRWEEDYDRRWSCAALLREHFRRVSLWHEVLSPTEPLYLETYDVAEAVAPMPEAVRRMVDTVWMPHIEGLGLMRQTERDTVGYLHWSGVLDLSRVKGVALPCPYEPLLRLYERGGCGLNPSVRTSSESQLLLARVGFVSVSCASNSAGGK